MNRQDLYFEPESYNAHAPTRQPAPDAIKARAAIHINGPQEYKESDGAINHFRNFIQSVLGKEQVIAPPPVGQQAAISGHMATLSYKNQKKAIWDEAAQKVTSGSATRHYGRRRHSPRGLVSPLDRKSRCGSRSRHRQRLRRLRLPAALHRAARQDLAALVVLERGLRRHPHFRHRQPHLLRSEARARDRTLLYGSLLVFFSLGPLMVLAGQKGLLALLVGVWAYYHVVRQHYGFLVLYKVKNRDLLPLDNTLDRVFLGVMMIFPPFHRFFIHHPEELGIRLAFPQWEPFFWVIRRRYRRRVAGTPGARPLPPRSSQVPAASPPSSRCTG
jgi:hypothetical protein